MTSVGEFTAYLSPYQDSRQYIKLLLLKLYLLKSNYLQGFDKWRNVLAASLIKLNQVVGNNAVYENKRPQGFIP